MTNDHQRQNFASGPLIKSLFTQKMELLIKCIINAPDSVVLSSEENTVSGKKQIFAKIQDFNINVSELIKRTNFSHLEFNQVDSDKALKQFGPHDDHAKNIPVSNLTSAEKIAINHYTGIHHRDINSIMYGKPYKDDPSVLKGALLKIAFIASGLNKIMPDTGVESETYHGNKPYSVEIQERIDLIKEGGGITETEAFLSTSLDLDTAENYSPLGGSVVYFDGRYGKNIIGLSKVAKESEYLIEPSMLLWTDHEIVNGRHVFHAKKVVPLIEDRDLPTDEDLTEFNKLYEWAKHQGIKTDFITSDLKSSLGLKNEIDRIDDSDIVDILPKLNNAVISINDCISNDNDVIQGLSTQSNMSLVNHIINDINNIANIAIPFFIFQMSNNIMMVNSFDEVV